MFFQKFAFLSLLDSLQAKDKLSVAHLNLIDGYFQIVTRSYEEVNQLSRLHDEDVFVFVHFMLTLAKIAKSLPRFYGRLNLLLKLDFVPTLIVRAHLSRKEDILLILFQLSGIEGFPNKKVASLLSRCDSKPRELPSKEQMSNKQQYVCTTNLKFIQQKFGDELDAIIERVNSKLDNNDMDLNTADLVQLYRQKINLLNDHLASLTASLDRATTELTEFQKLLSSKRQITEKQEFTNLCLLLDKNRLIKEVEGYKNNNKHLETSIADFTSKLEKSVNSSKVHKKELEGELIEKQILNSLIIFCLNFSSQIGKSETRGKFNEDQREAESHPR